MDLQFNIDPHVDINDIDYSLLGNNELIRNLIYQETYNGIKEAISKKSKHAKILEINTSGNYCTLDKKDFPQVIDVLIKHYEIQENYERCSELSNLKKKI